METELPRALMVNIPCLCLTVRSDSRRAQGGATHGEEGQEDLSMSSGLLAHRSSGWAMARNPRDWNSSPVFPGGRDAQAMVPLGRCWSTVPHYTPHCTHMCACTHTHTHITSTSLSKIPTNILPQVQVQRPQIQIHLWYLSGGSTCLPADPCLSPLSLGPHRKEVVILACCSHSRVWVHTHGSQLLAQPKREEHHLLYFLWVGRIKCHHGFVGTCSAL